LPQESRQPMSNSDQQRTNQKDSSFKDFQVSFEGKRIVLINILHSFICYFSSGMVIFFQTKIGLNKATQKFKNDSNVKVTSNNAEQHYDFDTHGRIRHDSWKSSQRSENTDTESSTRKINQSPIRHRERTNFQRNAGFDRNRRRNNFRMNDHGRTIHRHYDQYRHPSARRFDPRPNRNPRQMNSFRNRSPASHERFRRSHRRNFVQERSFRPYKRNRPYFRRGWSQESFQSSHKNRNCAQERPHYRQNDPGKGRER